MNLGKFIDEEIKKAIEAGDFANLEGSGKPLDLDAYFNTPEDLRMSYSVLKSSKFVPEEVERLKEIGDLKEQIRNTKDESQKAALTKTYHEKQLAFELLMERNKLRRK